MNHILPKIFTSRTLPLCIQLNKKLEIAKLPTLDITYIEDDDVMSWRKFVHEQKIKPTLPCIYIGAEQCDEMPTYYQGELAVEKIDSLIEIKSLFIIGVDYDLTLDTGNNNAETKEIKSDTNESNI